MKLLPAEPTSEMIRAGQLGVTTTCTKAIYRAMYAAAPESEVPGLEVVAYVDYAHILMRTGEGIDMESGEKLVRHSDAAAIIERLTQERDEARSDSAGYRDDLANFSRIVQEQLAAAQEDADRVKAERDAITELNQAQFLQLEKLTKSVDAIIFNSEEYEFDDGIGRGATQMYWDELDSARKEGAG